jgi:hypothetical protein
VNDRDYKKSEVMKMGNAIHTDADDHEEQDELLEEKVREEGEERPLSQRELMLEHIAASREQEMLKENPADEEPAAKEKGADQLASNRKFRVKIDGQELEVSEEELIKGYQKETSADRKLREISDIRKELQAEKAELDVLKEQLTRQVQPVVKEETTDGGEVDEFQEAYDLSLEGDPSKLLALMKQGSGKKDISAEELDIIVEERLSKRETDREHKCAEEAFKTDYPEIFGNPHLLSAANERYFAKVNEGKPLKEAMLEAGKETREWLAEMAGVRKPDVVTREDRLKNKSRISNLPIRGARAVTQVDDDDKPQDQSSIIAEMKASRA